MATNYYIEYPECRCCGRSNSPYHIGKASEGWCFMLHIEPENNINCLDDVMAEAQKGRVVSENGTELTIEEMKDVITQRRWPIVRPGIAGSNNLQRMEIDGRCIAHGTGPWDIVIGNFS